MADPRLIKGWTTKQELERFLLALAAEEYYDEDEGVNRFRHGGQCLVCTDSATRLAEHFGGVVMGYFAIDNLRAGIGLSLTEGHDFAVIDGRWLVDYWACSVAQVIPTPIFDLTKEIDRTLVARLYGPPSNWTVVEHFSEQTNGRRLEPKREYARAQRLSHDDAPRRCW